MHIFQQEFCKMEGKHIETIEIDSAFLKLMDNSFISAPCVRTRVEMEKLEKEKEDCFILDFDPDDADLDLSKLSISEENADDDLLIVAHKGKVACRDFPHPRHACARLPFKTTPKDSYCKQCYCYACDKPAPCKRWVGHYNHCLAIDNERWNTIRKLTREASKLQKRDASCRPHRRHRCVVYPFMTTHHKSHCELCYCYVCEVPAPCEKWDGSGMASHLHAISNKWWRLQRTEKRKARNLQNKEEAAVKKPVPLQEAEHTNVECGGVPHPGHACKIFPFRTTSSKSHCKFCQCYVCESPAPCTMWVRNLHCFANDNAMWKLLRKLTRQATK